jgi:hypothetical protein
VAVRAPRSARVSDPPAVSGDPAGRPWLPAAERRPGGGRRCTRTRWPCLVAQVHDRPACRPATGARSAGDRPEGGVTDTSRERSETRVAVERAGGSSSSRPARCGQTEDRIAASADTIRSGRSRRVGHADSCRHCERASAVRSSGIVRRCPSSAVATEVRRYAMCERSADQKACEQSGLGLGRAGRATRSGRPELADPTTPVVAAARSRPSDGEARRPFARHACGRARP